MKIYLQNTPHGLVPVTDSDYDEKKKLKIGQIYSAEIKLPRNYDFHKKYFALLECSWRYLTEKQQEFIKSKECFRSTLQIAAGFSKVYYSITRKEWVEESKSIAFDSMTEEEFRDLYDRVKDVLFLTFLKNISQEDFEKNLKDF
jgi:hypothetical protein